MPIPSFEFETTIPDNVRHNVNLLDHVESVGTGYVLHHPAGLSLHIQPIPGMDRVHVKVTVDEKVVKEAFEKSVAETSTVAFKDLK